jgi:hypothetical protein
MPKPTGPLSIALWVYQPSAPVEGDLIVGNGSGPVGYTGMELYTDPTGIYYFATQNLSLAAHRGAVTSEDGGQAGVPFAEWHHIVGTYDGDVLTIWLDGQLSGTSAPGALITYGTNEFAIAWYQFFGRYWAGSVDEFALWAGTALSPAEIDALYQRGAQGLPLAP